MVIEDMYQDFRDGTNLLLLLEVLTDEKLVKYFCILVYFCMHLGDFC